MPKDNWCVHRTHAYLYVCCNDLVGVCENVYCVAAVVEDDF